MGSGLIAASRIVLAAFFVLACAGAAAQPYPSRAIRIVVPFTPGGSTDIVARQLGESLRAAFGQSVVVENRPGAGGTIGMDLVAKSRPDGYTLAVVPGAFTINASLYGNLPYDTERDFAPIARIASVATMLVVHPSVPARSVGELLQLARGKPGQLGFASAGAGTVTHMSGELFKLMTGAEITHVPYKGSSQALNDLIGGQVQLMFANFPGTLQHVQAGRLRVIAVNGKERSALLPDVPTVDEAGVKGFDANTWYGLIAPAGTPAAIVEKLNAAANLALQSPSIREFLVADGGVPVGGTAEDFARFIREDIAKWAAVVTRSGLQR